MVEQTAQKSLASHATEISILARQAVPTPAVQSWAHRAHLIVTIPLT